MWKHRVILVMKVVHYFQGYEDDDERLWDAFISYKSNTPDEDFVVRTLFPKLARELGFNVNVHFKDFIAGEEITNNIIHAVENSRRTILVVSPNYLTSNFAKFEWQMAQQKMLERKHRIIPILLNDISQFKDTMDKNLKNILDSVTYIEWPGESESNPKKLDKFWKRIELSMPKKKNRASESTAIQNGGLVQNGGHYQLNNFSSKETGLKPDSVLLSVTDLKPDSNVVATSNTGVYSTINENDMLGPDEVYDTINEEDLDARVDITDIDKDKNEKNNSKSLNNVKDTPADRQKTANEYINIFKVDV